MSTAALWVDRALAVIGVHTAAVFLVMGMVAIVVFEKVGLAILRSQPTHERGPLA